MSNEMIQPYTGPQTIDLTELVSSLVDLPPGALRGVRREQPGIDGVVAELEASVPALGSKAAISPVVYESFKKNHDLVVKIAAARLVIDKLSEVLGESAAYYEDQRETDISLIATAVRASARQKDESLRAAFEKTLAYNAQIAMKAVKTRRKNAEAANGAASGSGGENGGENGSADEVGNGNGGENGGVIAPAPEVEAPEDGGAPPAGSVPAPTTP